MMERVGGGSLGRWETSRREDGGFSWRRFIRLPSRSLEAFLKRLRGDWFYNLKTTKNPASLREVLPKGVGSVVRGWG